MSLAFDSSRSDEYGFVVCGGGVAGVAAALCAARNGMSVALIERNGALGGTATLGGINYLLGGRKLKDGKHIRTVGGIFDELTDELIAAGEAVEPDSIDMTFNPVGWYPRMASGIVFNEPAMTLLMDEKLARAGVRVYYNSDIIGADSSDGRVECVYIHNKDGIVRIAAKLFADCTGDADLCAICGFPFENGRKEDGLSTPATLIMHVENVDTQAFVSYQNAHNSPKLTEIIDRLKAAGEWDFTTNIFVCMQLPTPGVFLINAMSQVRVDGTSEASVSAALTEGRRIACRMFETVRRNFPGFENARLRRVFDFLGVRESRRIKSLHDVTLEEALSGERYPDTVAATTYNFDLPDPLKPDYDPMLGDVKKPNDEREHTVIRIPYRSLIPKGAQNLIVAGRCIGCCREVMGAARITAPAMMTGEAAGMAAALAGEDFTSVDSGELRKRLFASGVKDPDALPFK